MKKYENLVLKDTAQSHQQCYHHLHYLQTILQMLLERKEYVNTNKGVIIAGYVN